MKRTQSRVSRSKFRKSPLQALAIALLTSTLIVSGAPQLLATPLPHLISQRQNNWDCILRMARLVNANQQTTALVLQLDVDDKPETTYANVVYQVFARLNGRWTPIYTNTGARLISSAPGRMMLPPEVIEIAELERALDNNITLSNLDLKAVAQIRYDARGGRRDQRVEWEQVAAYNTLARTTTTQLASVQSSQTTTQSSQTTTGSTTQQSSIRQSTTQQSTTQQSTPATEAVEIDVETATSQRQTTTQQTARSQTGTTTQQRVQPLPVERSARPNNTLSAHRGHFGLAIRQAQVTVPEVIARVSLKYKRPDAFLQERLVGDFRYRMNQRAQFIRGLNPGDRVVVRLFDLQGYFIGYSEFELLEDNAAVNLILPDDISSGVVRTVYGIDSNRNGDIDSGVQVYDYFTRATHVSSSSYSNAQVSFYENTSSFNTSAFNVSGLPAPRSNCVYPISFQSGSFALANRTLRAFSPNLARGLIARPGEVVQVRNTSTTSVSSYEVSNLIVNYREVGYTEGVIMNTCDVGCVGGESSRPVEINRGNSNRNRSQSDCNQGIGNGPEGCDPGRSRPHGSSNDEGGRMPGNRRSR